MRRFCRLQQILGVGMRSAKGQVLANRLAEEESLLRHHADVAPQDRQRILAHRPPVDEQRAFGRFVEPRNQVGESGLAASRRPHNRQARSRRNVQRDVA